MRLESINMVWILTVDTSPDNVHAIQIYKTFQSKVEIPERQFDINQHKAFLQEKHWTETV